MNCAAKPLSASDSKQGPWVRRGLVVDRVGSMATPLLIGYTEPDRTPLVGVYAYGSARWKAKEPEKLVLSGVALGFASEDR